MPSMDAIREGQSLIIPPLEGQSIKPNVGFVQKIKNAIKKPTASTSSKVYTVKEGDTLSRISAKQLGSAKRYSEIVKLNKSLKKNEDLIYVGMKINLPK
jgi:nucleoid-associated protein YgaU